jgi:hypothetical protein
VIAAAVVWAYFGIATPLIVMLVVEALLRYRLRNLIEEVLYGSENASRDLGLLSGVLVRVEQQTLSAPRLQSLQRELLSHGLTSSDAVAISWRPEMFRVKPARFTSSNSLRSSASITVRGGRVFRSSSKNSQNQPCRKLNCTNTRFMLTPVTQGLRPAKAHESDTGRLVFFNDLAWAFDPAQR